MTHLGSLEGHGRLILDPGNEIGVRYQIDVFQTEDDQILAGGRLAGDPGALSGAANRLKAAIGWPSCGCCHRRNQWRHRPN